MREDQHRCVWFHSLDYGHNISCCKVHEVCLADGTYAKYPEAECPICKEQKVKAP